MKHQLFLALLLSTSPLLAHADLTDSLKKAGSSDLGAKVTEKTRDKAKAEGNKKIAAKVNTRLLAESRKNQCSFKSGTDELAPGCGSKSKKLAETIIDVKNTLQSQGQSGFKFIVSGHTDSTGNASANKELSMRRAQVMVKELIAKGVHKDDIEAIGMGSESMMVKPDNTPAKQAKNRRYEVQVRF
jgi:OOP family OmpA-OmpF porin